MVGKTISHYKVLEKIGEGGMGEVYRATDTKLNRDVALKILPEQFASDSQRMGRFQREAEVLASLDHPNIGQIYGIEDAGETKALVLQLIEGPTLAERIAQGPIPVEEALKIALQMAEGLEAAHEKGVIHRDLKPANIKITPEGQVKILDFGLAKALEGETPPDSGLSQSPTLTAAATQAGVILGTAAYMSPEQARGENADQRADVWAFGVVLFEMLTGRRTFEGRTVSDVLAAVLATEPQWNSLPDNLHPRLRQLLERCLSKELRNRYASVGDGRVDIQTVLADPAGVLVQPTADVVQAQPRQILPWVLAAVVLTAVTASVAVWNLRPTEPQPPAARFYHELPDGQVFTRTGRPLVAVSPDGSRLVYVANEQLYLRNLAELEARPIQGTDESPNSPFFSPEGEWVGYWSRSDSQLKKIATIGGASVTLCDATNPFGASWGSDDTIVYGQAEGIVRVSANGGTPELVVPTEAAERVHGPQMLPGGEWVLFTLTSASGQTRWDQAQIVVQSLESGERKILWEGGSDARYVPTGHLIYALEGVLFALPFDLSSLEVSGGPVSMVEGVRRAFESQGNTATANYGFSDRGTLIYVPGLVGGVVETFLGMIDRTGRIEGLELPPGGYSNPRVSSDGDRVAYMRVNRDDVDIVIYELLGTSAPRPLTFGGENSYPIWSADGEHVAFQSDREGDLGIFWQRADGTGGLERLTTPEEGVAHIPDAFSPDGETLSFTSVGKDESAVWMLALQEQEATVFAAEPSALLGQSVFSPDGRWIAYQSNETGTFEIIVQPLPPTGTKYRVPNTEIDHHASWSPNGSELFYVPSIDQLVVVALTLKPRLEFGNPLAIPRGGFLGGPSATIRPYDIMPDGERFIAVFPSAAVAGDQSGAAEPPSLRINVVLNWFEELKERVPVP